MKPRPFAPSPVRAALAALLAASLLSACHRHDDDDDGFVLVSSSVEVEPNDQSLTPNFLGVLRPGEVIVVEGVAAAGLDEFDGFAIALVQPTEIEFTLSFDDFTGELDAWVYDPAIADFALFFESDFSPERGVFVVGEPVLDFQLVVRAFSGQADYRLEIAARHAPLHATSEAPDAGLWRGAIRSVPGFPTKERAELGARSAARDRYLGREIAVAREPELEQVGVLIALPAEGEAAGTIAEPLVVPLHAAPGRAPRALLQ